MIYNVRMLAHHDINHIRPVYVPAYNQSSVDTLLDDIFKYGQNDFACGPDASEIRRSTCSVSVGDVIELPEGDSYLVSPVGFKLLKSSDYDRYKAMNNEDRWLYRRS